MRRFDPRIPADSTAAFTATVRALEGLVPEYPAQWLMFEDVWRDPPARTLSARASRAEAGRRSALAGIRRSEGRALLRQSD